MRDDPARVQDSRELGRSGRGRDATLGLLAIAPIGVLAGWSAVAGRSDVATIRAASSVWTGALVAFLAGVRRGLSFSEENGARITEVATFLGLFFLAIPILVLRSPALGAFGLAAVGLADTLGARRREAPAYFQAFRPIQMGLGALGLALIAACVGV